MEFYVGRYIYLRTILGRIYSGKVKEVVFMGYGTEKEPIYLITIIDKYGDLVSINSKGIMFIEEESENFKKEEKDDDRGTR